MTFCCVVNCCWNFLLIIYPNFSQIALDAEKKQATSYNEKIIEITHHKCVISAIGKYCIFLLSRFYPPMNYLTSQLKTVICITGFK